MITKPIFIVGCNRSGTTLLFRTLSAHPRLWSLYIEAQDQFYRHFPVDDHQGDRVADDPDPQVVERLTLDLYRAAHNKERFQDSPVLGWIPPKVFQRPLGVLWKRPGIRLVEKTPANALRIPMLARAFPDAQFLFLVRRGEDVVSSLMEGWKNWTPMPEGEPWEYRAWHYLRPPGWREWVDRSLEEICTFQWVTTNELAQADLDRYAAGRYLLLRHEDQISDPTGFHERIASFCDIDESASFDQIVSTATQRLFTTGGSAPRAEKWKSLHYEEIVRMRERIEPLNARYYADPWSE